MKRKILLALDIATGLIAVIKGGYELYRWGKTKMKDAALSQDTEKSE